MQNLTTSKVVCYDYVSLLARKIIGHVTCEENRAYMKKEVHYAPFYRNFNDFSWYMGHIHNNLNRVPLICNYKGHFNEEISYMPLFER